MAELNNINIMGDESDVEFVEPPSKDNEHKNGVMNAGKSVGDANGSKFNGSHSVDTSDSSDTSDSAMARQEPMLTWAQNHSQSLSMCVASILSDHDYLSQDDLLRIIESNEESLELEKQSQKQREINDNDISNSTLPKDPETDTQKTIIYTQEALDSGGGSDPATHSSVGNEKSVSNDGIDDLNDILQKLKSSKNEEKSALLDQILEKVNRLKIQTVGNKETTEKVKEEPKEKCTAQNQSNSTSEFSSNHSEPMEYYGGPKFSTQSSIEDAKGSDGMCLECCIICIIIFKRILNFMSNIFRFRC